MTESKFEKDIQFYKFCAYGFLKNLKFFEPFIILFFIEKGLSFTAIGTLYATREISIILFEIPTGFFADIVGRRLSMILCFSFYIISFLIYYFTSSFWLFLLATIIFACAEAFRSGTHKALIFEYLKLKGWENQKVNYYGHTRSASQIGSAISALLAALIVINFTSYSSIFLWTILPYLLGIILILTYPKNLEPPELKIKLTLKNKFKKTFSDFAACFKSLNTFKAIGNVAVHGGFYRALKDYLQPLLKSLSIALILPVFKQYPQKNVSAIVIGIVYSIVYILSSICAKNSAKVTAKFKTKSAALNFTLFTGIISGMCAGILFHFKFYWLAVIFYLIIFLNENIRKPAGITLISELIKRNVIGSVLSFETQLRTFWSSVLALLVGIASDYLGVGMAIFIISLPLFFISLFFKLNRPQTQGEL